MTDVTQGQDATTDNDLFNEATTSETLTAFENPKPEPDLPEPAPKETEPKADAARPHPAVEDNAPVPSGRFREESAARRKAEQERDDLQRQIELLSRRQQAPAREQLQAPPKVDMFENPQGFVEQTIAPYLEQVRDDFQKQREAMSLNYAVDRHGGPTVSAARQQLEEGMSRGDPNAWGTYNRAMQSQDPYGVIVRWHRDVTQLQEIGGDLEGYKQRIREEALQDPEYRKRVIETLRSQANGSAQQVFRPAGRQQSQAPAPSPSLGDIGASGGETTVVEPSDDDLFRAATRAKRR